MLILKAASVLLIIYSIAGCSDNQRYASPRNQAESIRSMSAVLPKRIISEHESDDVPVGTRRNTALEISLMDRRLTSCSGNGVGLFTWAHTLWNTFESPLTNFLMNEKSRK